MADSSGFDDFTADELENAAKYFAERKAAALSFLRPSVRPLGVYTAFGDELLPAGSSCLLWHRGRRYIATAEHVVGNHPSQSLYVATNSDWIELPPRFIVAKKNVPKPSRPAPDFAFQSLPDDVADRLVAGGCRFLEARAVGSGVEFGLALPLQARFMAIGWPQNRFNFSRSQKRTAPEILTYLSTPAAHSKYEFAGLSPGTHLALDFDRKRVVVGIRTQTAPMVEGLSGGGMFRMPSIEQRGSVGLPSLAAITTEHHAAHDLMSGIRIETVLWFIDRAREEGLPNA